AVVEMSQSSWLVGGVLPGIERQPRKKQEPSAERLLGLLHRWRSKLPDDPPSPTLDTELTTNIVAAYVRRNQIGADQLPILISTVHQALATLGKPVAELDRERTPAVPIPRS